jgi:hypothetical protein
MGADWGLYSALRGTDNWAQKRQDKMQSLMFLEKREQRAQQDLQKQTELEAGMQQYFDQIANLDALAEDQGRIQDEEKKARRDIYKGIAAVNGNLKTYMTTGGVSAIGKYKRDVLGSDAVKNAALNKVNMTNFIKDKSDGKYIKNVEVDIPVMEADGKTPKLKNGVPVTKKEAVGMERALEMFQKGIITKLPYSGAEVKVKLDPTKFSSVTKDPNNPFVAMAVTTDDIFNYAIEQGASKEYAKDLAIEYGKSAVKTKQPWFWGKEDESAYNLKMAQAGGKSVGAGGGKKGGVMVLNQLVAELTRAEDNAVRTGKDALVQLGPKEYELWDNMLGLGYDSTTGKTVPKRPLKAIDAQSGKEVNVGNATNLGNTGEYVFKNGKWYIKYEATYNADEPQTGNPMEESWWFGVNNLADDFESSNWEYLNAPDGTDVYKGMVLVEVDKKVREQRVIDQVNKSIGVTNAQQGVAAGMGSEDQLNKVRSDMSRIYQGLIDKNVDPETAKQQVLEMYSGNFNSQEVVSEEGAYDENGNPVE